MKIKIKMYDNYNSSTYKKSIDFTDWETFKKDSEDILKQISKPWWNKCKFWLLTK